MNTIYQFRNRDGRMIVHSTDSEEKANRILCHLPFTQIENKILCKHTQFEYELTVFKAERELIFEDLQEFMSFS